MDKKQLPITLLQALDRLNSELSSMSENFNHLIEKDFNENKLIRFQDIDKNSDFIFEIKGLYLDKGVPIFTIESSPSSINDNKLVSRFQHEKGASLMFQNWIDWLLVYENTHLTPEDELQKQYEEEFYSEFVILDENANKEPFSLEQQLFLDEYLRTSQEKLILLSDGKNNEEAKEIDQLIAEAESIRKVLTKESKNKIIKRLSKFWGKAKKTSIDVVKAVIVEIIAEFGKLILIGK
jgi:hypothetical protein